MSQKKDRKENYYKYLEDSVCSNPESIYIDTEESKVSFNSSVSFVIIDDYFNDHLNINRVDRVLDKKKEANTTFDITDNNPIFSTEENDKDELNRSEISKEYKDKFNNSEKSTGTEHQKLNTCDNFFDYFNENLSINNVISCENLDKSTIFDDNENIFDENINPFEKHDVNFYDADKNKHKGKKNMDKLGMVTLSTVVLIGSTWINKYFG